MSNDSSKIDKLNAFCSRESTQIDSPSNQDTEQRVEKKNNTKKKKHARLH